MCSSPTPEDGMQRILSTLGAVRTRTWLHDTTARTANKSTQTHILARFSTSSKQRVHETVYVFEPVQHVKGYLSGCDYVCTVFIWRLEIL